MASISIQNNPTVNTPTPDYMSAPIGPLASLYKNEYQVGKYYYPDDIGTSSQRMHVIQFTASALKNSKYSTQNGGQSSSLPSLTDVGNAAEALLNNPTNPVLSTTISNVSDVINLYMPDGIAMSYDAGYDSVNITDFKAMQIYEMLKTLSSENANWHWDKDWNWKDIGGSISKYISTHAGEIGATTLSGLNAALGGLLPIGAAAQSSGIAFNPQLQVIFKGVDTRKFVFQFIFTPKSQKEAAEVSKIIQRFRFHAAPEYSNNDADGTSGVGLYFVPPSIFGISYLYQGTDNPYMTKIKQCVLQTVNVEYGAQGSTWATFVDGAPIQTRLSLNFQEINIITKDDINQGY